MQRVETFVSSIWSLEKYEWVQVVAHCAQHLQQVAEGVAVRKKCRLAPTTVLRCSTNAIQRGVNYVIVQQIIRVVGQNVWCAPNMHGRVGRPTVRQ